MRMLQVEPRAKAIYEMYLLVRAVFQRRNVLSLQGLF